MVSPTRSFAGQTSRRPCQHGGLEAFALKLCGSSISSRDCGHRPADALEYGNAKPNQTVMILGAAGNVGAYAVQLAVNAGLQVIGVVGSKDIEYVKALGSQTVVNYQSSTFQNAVRPVDLVLDTVGGETRERAYSVLRSGGVLVSVVSTDPMPERPNTRSVFFYAEVTTERLNGISRLFDSGQLTPQVGNILPLTDVRTGNIVRVGLNYKFDWGSPVVARY